MKLQRMGDTQAYCGTNKISYLKLFDKLKAKITLVDMVDKEVNKRISKIGLSGGYLRLSYNSKKNALWLKVDYLSAK